MFSLDAEVSLTGTAPAGGEHRKILFCWTSTSNLLLGQGSSHLEWPIHTEVMRPRPDVGVVGHTHPCYSVLFSATEPELAALSHEGANLVGKVARFSETAGLINTTALGRLLAAAIFVWPIFSG